MQQYQVIVQKSGTICYTDSKKEALEVYNKMVVLSKGQTGAASGMNISLVSGYYVISEHTGHKGKLVSKRGLLI